MSKNIRKVVNEEIRKLVRSKSMLNEYRNPRDRDIIRACADQLEGLYNRIISDGNSKHEYSIERLFVTIRELRKIEKYFS